MSRFQTLERTDLIRVHGGADEEKTMPPPQKVDGQDLIDVTKAAIKTVVNPLSAVANVPEAIDRATRTDRVGKGFADRALDAFTGIFGLDATKSRPAKKN